ncbi:hypothetical protein EQ500_00560 [Lactobacillus sp. XV13L]|nr:hypothetical protein [Lactobacillus sp. XV13L]
MTSGCAKQKKQALPVLTKTAAIKKAQEPFKSGQVQQTVDLRTDTSSQLVATTYTFGGDPTVFHLNYQTQNKKGTRSAEEWISNTGALFLNGQSTWYKAQLAKTTGHTYADILEAVMNNQMLMDPPSTLTKAYKMKRKGRTYTLTATVKDKNTIMSAVKPIFFTNTQSPQQVKVFNKLGREGKPQDMRVKLVVKNNKLFTFNYTAAFKIEKLYKLSVGQSYSNINQGKNDFLKIPTNVLNAKPLPKNNKKK